MTYLVKARNFRLYFPVNIYATSAAKQKTGKRYFSFFVCPMKGQDSIAQTKPVDDSCRRTKVFAIPLLLVSGGVYGGVNEDISIFRRRRIGFLSHRTKSVRALS